MFKISYKHILYSMEYSQYFTITNNIIWEEYNKAVHCHPAYLTSIHSTSYEMLNESHSGIKIARRNISNLWCADDTTLMAESEEELKSLLMREKEETEKAGLKCNIQKTKVMASSPITSWQTGGEILEAMTDLFSWAPKSLQLVTAAMKLKDACSWEGKL